MENRKNKRQLLRKQKKLIKLTRFFSVAAVDAKDNVTQQFSDPSNVNSNLLCAVESAPKSETPCLNQLSKINHLSPLVRQIQKRPSIHHHHCRILFLILSLMTRINGPTLYLAHLELT